MKNLPLWVILLGVALFAGGGAVVYSATRGLRNNNPGNLKHTSDQWNGMSPVQSDPMFVSFLSPEYGIRALYKVLQTYKNNGLDTIEKVITKWAPASDNNDTTAYISAVARQLNFSPTSTLPQAAYPDLVKAIISHENGVNPYSDATIQRGISLA